MFRDENLSEKDLIYRRLLFANNFKKDHDQIRKEAFVKELKKAIRDYSICLLIGVFIAAIIVFAAW